MIRTFTITFDNSKRRMPHVPHQQYEAEGIVFSSGHVVIDTVYAPRPDYSNLLEMQAELGKWGKCEIVWMESEVQV